MPFGRQRTRALFCVAAPAYRWRHRFALTAGCSLCLSLCPATNLTWKSSAAASFAVVVSRSSSISPILLVVNISSTPTAPSSPGHRRDRAALVSQPHSTASKLLRPRRRRSQQQPPTVRSGHLHQSASSSRHQSDCTERVSSHIVSSRCVLYVLVVSHSPPPPYQDRPPSVSIWPCPHCVSQFACYCTFPLCPPRP